METSKRRQIPTMNECPNFSFRGLRKKKNFVTLLRDYFHHAENCFRHADKLHTSQQWIMLTTQYMHTRAIILLPQLIFDWYGHRLLKNQVCLLSVCALQKCRTARHLKNQVNALITCLLSLTVGLLIEKPN